MTTVPVQDTSIPLLYRILFMHFEPYAAIGGVIQLYFTPKEYLKIATPHLYSLIKDFPSNHDKLFQSLYTQIGAGWLIIIMNDLFTLRAFQHDMKVWRYMLSAHLASDLFYTWALILDMGENAWIVGNWTWSDWFMMVTTLPPLFAKIAFIAGFGLKSAVATPNKTKKAM